MISHQFTPAPAAPQLPWLGIAATPEPRSAGARWATIGAVILGGFGALALVSTIRHRRGY